MRCGLVGVACAVAVCGRKIWKNERSASGRNWQARRIDGSAPAPTRLSTKASRLEGAGNALQSPITRIRQVEHRAPAPQTPAGGAFELRSAPSTLRPAGTRTLLPVP